MEVGDAKFIRVNESRVLFFLAPAVQAHEVLVPFRLLKISSSALRLTPEKANGKRAAQMF
jgi:hypothetical protein